MVLPSCQLSAVTSLALDCPRQNSTVRSVTATRASLSSAAALGPQSSVRAASRARHWVAASPSGQERGRSGGSPAAALLKGLAMQRKRAKNSASLKRCGKADLNTYRDIR